MFQTVYLNEQFLFEKWENAIKFNRQILSDEFYAICLNEFLLPKSILFKLHEPAASQDNYSTNLRRCFIEKEVKIGKTIKIKNKLNLIQAY